MTSSTPAVTALASSSRRLAEARSPAMLAAIEDIDSAVASGRRRPASRSAAAARSRAGVAAVGSTSNTAMNPRRYWARAWGSGSPPPVARNSSSHRTPSVVARVAQYQRREAARSIPREMSAVNQASPKDRADVVDLQVDPFEPLDQPVPGPLLRSPTPRDVVLDASQLDDVLLTCLPQLEGGELAHRLVQPIAGGDPLRPASSPATCRPATTARPMPALPARRRMCTPTRRPPA